MPERGWNMATFTSASASKYLRSLEDEKSHLLQMESETCTYVLAQDEEAEPPSYDYAGTRRRVSEIDGKVRAVRHALHRFNMETLLPKRGISIDEALIEMAQLSAARRRLDTMRAILPREREGRGYGNRLIEYRYANFDVAKAQSDYLALSQQISDLQLEIDLCNQTETFEVDVEA